MLQIHNKNYKINKSQNVLYLHMKNLINKELKLKLMHLHMKMSINYKMK